MASEHRATNKLIALEKALQQTPYDFDFYQAVRRLECAYNNRPRIGQSRRAIEDPVRFGQEPSLAFAPSTLASFTPADEHHFAQLAVAFFGLFGPNGALPLHLTEYVRDRQRNNDDHTFRVFADLFHHRMLTLFYRAWGNAQPTVNYDRPKSDRFALYVGSVLGLGMPSLRHRDEMPDLAKFYYAGWLSGHTHHAEGLQMMLTDFFNIPARIEQFVGHWMPLPEECRWRLGHSLETGTLGMSATLGGAVWECQHKFRIVVGPLGLADYQRFLPGGKSVKRLVAMVRQYCGDEMHWDLNLILKKEELPPFILGEAGLLGWTTWLTNEALAKDADHLLIDPMIH